MASPRREGTLQRVVGGEPQRRSPDRHPAGCRSRRSGAVWGMAPAPELGAANAQGVAPRRDAASRDPGTPAPPVASAGRVLTSRLMRAATGGA